MKILRKIHFENRFLVLYLIIGFLWIFFSDSFVSSITDNYEIISKIQTFKGSFYVLVTGLIFYLIIKKHIKKLRKAEIDAKKSDALKTAFLQNISHEIRTPMNGIVGFTNLIKNKEYDNEHELSEYTNIISSSSKQLLTVIEDIVDLAKHESSNVTYHMESIDVEQLISDVKNMTEFFAETKNINIIVNKPNQPIKITSDKYHIQKVLINLINNAIKFTDSGDIVIGYDMVNDNLSVYVKDSGIGVPDEIKEKIFDDFFQIDISTPDIYSGIGLSLAISKKIITSLGGKIKVESEANKGSKFYFTLPANVISKN